MGCPVARLGSARLSRRPGCGALPTEKDNPAFLAVEAIRSHLTRMQASCTTSSTIVQPFSAVHSQNPIADDFQVKDVADPIARFSDTVVAASSDHPAGRVADSSMVLFFVSSGNAISFLVVALVAQRLNCLVGVLSGVRDKPIYVRIRFSLRLPAPLLIYDWVKKS